MGHSDQLTNVPKRITRRVLRWLANYQTASKPYRVAGMAAFGLSFGTLALLLTTEPAAAQWCSMPVLSWITGQVGNVTRGFLILCGVVAWAFCGTYAMGGRLAHTVVTFSIGIALVASGAFLPEFTTYALSGGDATLQSMDLGCLWDGGTGGGG